jgi:hypothetical protein
MTLTEMRAARDEILVEVRSLGDVPVTAAAAIHGTSETIAAWLRLEELARRWSELAVKHLEMVRRQMQRQEIDRHWLDTQVNHNPAVVPLPAAGPGGDPIMLSQADMIARLSWLAKPEAAAWTPSGPEASAARSAFERWISDGGPSRGSSGGRVSITPTYQSSPDAVRQEI